MEEASPRNNCFWVSFLRGIWVSIEHFWKKLNGVHGRDLNRQTQTYLLKIAENNTAFRSDNEVEMAPADGSLGITSFKRNPCHGTGTYYQFFIHDWRYFGLLIKLTTKKNSFMSLLELMREVSIFLFSHWTFWSSVILSEINLPVPYQHST